MSVILLLIALSVIFATGFVVAFIWAVRTGQYEDTCTPSMRLLLDDQDEFEHGAALISASSSRIRRNPPSTEAAVPILAGGCSVRSPGFSRFGAKPAEAGTPNQETAASSPKMRIAATEKTRIDP